MTLMHDVRDVESSPVAGLFTESNEKEGLVGGPLIEVMRGQRTRGVCFSPSIEEEEFVK